MPKVLTEKTIFLSPITGKEFLDITEEVCKKMSYGYDEIPCAIIRRVSIYILAPLVNIINATFEQGLFPTALKRSVIKPIHKKGNRTEMRNYRPISIQSGFSKIIEKAMYRRLTSFLSKHKLINDCQHGFREGKSTQTALASFVHEVTKAMDNKKESIGIFYDYSKAFDSVNHEILLKKLPNYGIRGNALAWIRSYLKDRKQLVGIKDRNNALHYSNEITVNIAVPQGGTIAPLLFILFVNDLHQNITLGKMTVYADDTTQHISSEAKTKEDYEQFILICNKAASQMSNYSSNNDLIINKEKTVYMQFRRPHNKIISSPLIKIDKTVVHEVEEIKFLGLHVSNTLKWGAHVNKLAPEIASACYLIKRVMQIATQKIALLIYYANIHSKLQYGVILWGNCKETKRLFILQKRALRYMARASSNPTADFYYKDSCKPLFKRFKILTIPCIYIFNTIMYKVNNVTTDEVDSKYKTRTKGNFKSDRIKLELSKKDPKYAGGKLFNALPNAIKEKKGLALQNSLKEFLIESCFYSVNEYCIL